MAAVVTGLADLRGRTEQRPRFADVAIALTKVDAVGAETPGERHTVIDDECDLGVGADTLERLGKPGERMLIHVLDPQLERRGDPRLERRLQPVRKSAANLGWTDEVQLARPLPAGSKGLRKSLSDFVQSQAGALTVDAS